MAPSTAHLIDPIVVRSADVLLRGREPWMADAACAGRTQLFFGIAGERPERRVRREQRARKVCATCPVIADCREMARRNGENGFWGGESEEERAAAGFPPVSISRRSVQDAATSARSGACAS
jgi:WhiB family redox-sensing transcriptional regulator